MRIAGEESERLLKMEDALHERIIGQDEAISIARQGGAPRARRASRTRSARSARSSSSGPTGVGKTELAQGAGRVHVRLRGASDQDRHVGVHGAPLGQPAGWARLRATSATKRAASSPKRCAASRYSVILLDEIEKAHPEAFNMLLQIMEDGNLADAKGRKVDFRNTIIIMTSNVGAEQITRDMNLGFAIKEDEEKTKAREYDRMRRRSRRSSSRPSGRSSSIASTR